MTKKKEFVSFHVLCCQINASDVLIHISSRMHLTTSSCNASTLPRTPLFLRPLHSHVKNQNVFKGQVQPKMKIHPHADEKSGSVT